MQQSTLARGVIRALSVAALLLAANRAAAGAADDRFTVCSVTINSDDEIRTFEKYLPSSEFRFVELTDQAKMTKATPAAGDTSWFGKACESGVRCDVLMVSAHFGNTWAGNYGTTFAGSSGISLSLEELERRRCDASCPAVLGDPLEVFLFGCKTMSDGSADVPPAKDVALLARHDVTAGAAARILDEARNGGEDTSSRRRMEFVFGGVPRIYGFTEVAPAGKRVAPLLEKYLQGVGDYAAHLRQLRQAARANRPTFNEPLADALSPTCFTQSGGLDLAGSEYARDYDTCYLNNEQSPVADRFEHVADLLDGPRFLTSLPAIHAFLRRHPSAAFDAAAATSSKRSSEHTHARAVARELLGQLESPILRLEILRISRTMGWISESEALPIQRQVVLKLLSPPVYGEGRDLVCGLGPDVLERIDVRAEDVPPAAYRDEYGIQALGCLKPKDPRVHAELARSMADSREWVARAAASALNGMRPSSPHVLASFR